MPNEHAEFSPSRAHRFLRCTASHDLEKQLPDTSGEAAKEGSRIHALAEKCLTCDGDPEEYRGGSIREIAQEDGWVDYKFALNRKYEHPISDDAIDLVSFYVSYIRAKSEKPQIEDRIDICQDCYGTADATFLRGYTLYIVDLKTGYHKVSAQNNDQLMAYAYGKVKTYPEATRAKLVIIQAGRVEDWTVSRADLEEWGKEFEATIKAIREKHTAFNIGDQCKWCKAEAICPEKTRTILKDFEDSSHGIDDSVVSKILDRAEEIESWLKAAREYAINKIKAGGKVEGYKLVPKQARAKIRDEQSAISEFEAAGLDCWEKSLLSIAKLRKIVPSDMLEKHIVKESSGMNLAKEGVEADLLEGF